MMSDMDLVVPRIATEIAPRDLPAHPQQYAASHAGLNIEPGSADDGWIIPPAVTLSDGSQAQLYKDGEALQAAYQAIQKAQGRICLEVYIFADDPTGRAFADLLSEKARQGVSVYVLYDSFGSIGTDRNMFRQMQRAGVRVEQFHPVRPWETRFGWRPCNRDHRKLLVVDDKFAWLGGLNIGAEYAGSWVIASPAMPESGLWRDNAIGIAGPAVRNFLSTFVRSWRYVTHGGKIRNAEYMYGIDLGDLATRRTATRARTLARRGHIYHFAPESTLPDIGILASTPTTSSILRLLLHRMLSEAQKSVRLTMAYFAPDDDLIDALCRASKRGVKVQLMLPSRGDVRVLVVAARSFYDKLMCNGIEVFERQNCVLHAKTMVADGRVSVLGSTNLDYRSIEFNCELSAIIRSERFGQQMVDLFNNDIRFARRIDEKEWRKRPWGDRFMQWAVSRARYVL